MTRPHRILAALAAALFAALASAASGCSSGGPETTATPHNDAGSGGDDAGTEPIAPADGAAEVDAGTACAASHTFCADFEDGPIDIAFGLAEFAGGGTFSPSEEHPRTGARSLHVTIPEIPTDGEGLAALVQQVQGTPMTLTLAVDVWIDAASETSDAIKLGNDGGLVVLRLASAAGGATATLVEPLADGTEHVLALPGTLATSTWVHLEIAVAMTSTGSTATVRANGAVALDRAPLTQLRAGGNSFWWIGIDTYAGATPVAPWSVFFDDVTLDAS